MKREAIALLITLFFVIAITISIGIGLKQVNRASAEVESENFMLQTTVIADDILSILKTSSELDTIVEKKSSEALFIFLSKTNLISFESEGIDISLALKSARAKINPNTIMSNQASANVEIVSALKEYLNRYNINAAYVDIMLDTMGGIKQNLPYNSEIFYDKTDLFRDYIVSRKHLAEVDDFYKKTYYDNSLKNVDFDNLFYFGIDKNSSIDLNHASADVWELMLGCTKERAHAIKLKAGTWSGADDTTLESSEKIMLERFKTSYFEPFLEVVVEVKQRDNHAKVKFEYDMQKKQGTNFSYEI